jgi:hypothetical protein
MLKQGLRISHLAQQERHSSWKIGLVVLLLAVVSVRLTLAAIQAPQPQAILSLSSGTNREQFTAQLAQSHPDLEVWVSSGVAPAKALPISGLPRFPNSASTSTIAPATLSPISQV